MLFPTFAFTLAVMMASFWFEDNGFFTEEALSFLAGTTFGTATSSRPSDGIGTDMSNQTPEAAIGDMI